MSKVLWAFLVLILGASSQGQDSFPDVPNDHWAAKAVKGLKEAGVLFGYPNGVPTEYDTRSDYDQGFMDSARKRWQLAGLLVGDPNGQYNHQILDKFANGAAAYAAGQRLVQIGSDLETRDSSFSSMLKEIPSIVKVAFMCAKELKAMGVEASAILRQLRSLAERSGHTLFRG